MSETQQDTPEAVERLAEDCDARSCDGGSDPLLQDITIALRAYARLLRQVEKVRERIDRDKSDWFTGISRAVRAILDGEPGAQL